MNQDASTQPVLNQPDGPVQGPHILLDEEGLAKVRHDIPKLGAFMTDLEVEALHQLDGHRQAVRDNGWNSAPDSTYTDDDHFDHNQAIAQADADIRKQASTRRLLNDPR